MKILRNIKELNNELIQIRKKGLQIGLIPTMGSIHKGHLSLLKKSNNLKLYSIVTIYINPTQFNNKDDYLKYPKDRKKDILKLKKNSCDAIFFPKQKEIYPKGLKTEKKVKKFRNILCDKFRPGHFDGVTTVVEFFLKTIHPNYAFFGEKDFQQFKIIDTLNNVLKINTTIYPCPSIRMKNSFSYSSRFKFFSSQDKKNLKICVHEISLLIKKIKKDIKKINLEKYKSIIIKKGVKSIDYLEIRNEKNLSLSRTSYNSRLFIALYIGNIRVIDNFVLY